jgi:hypothetical protein
MLIIVAYNDIIASFADFIEKSNNLSREKKQRNQ